MELKKDVGKIMPTGEETQFKKDFLDEMLFDDNPENLDVIKELGLEELEQPVDSDVAGSNKILGKFVDTLELAKAYETLQAEFSRKSQELAEFKKVEKPTVESVCKEDIIKEYLTSISKSQTAPTVITTASDFCFGAKAEPRTLKDLTKVAAQYFKTKEIIK